MKTPELPANLERQMERIARAAGGILMRHYDRLQSADIDFKGPRDLLTIADRESEAFVVEELKATFPDHAIWAEESGRDERAAAAIEGQGFVWLIDPLDGTTNFVHSHPFFAVAMGLVYAGRPVAGVVYAPRLDEMYVGVEGRGAFMNGRPIKVGRAKAIKDAMMSTGFAYKMDTAPNDNTENFRRIVREARGVRRCGSASIDLAFIAAGRYDGFWELDLAPWDVAAGGAIIREAGGRVTDFTGGDQWVFSGRIIATNGLLHDELRSKISG